MCSSHSSTHLSLQEPFVGTKTHGPREVQICSVGQSQSWPTSKVGPVPCVVTPALGSRSSPLHPSCRRRGTYWPAVCRVPFILLHGQSWVNSCRHTRAREGPLLTLRELARKPFSLQNTTECRTGSRSSRPLRLINPFIESTNVKCLRSMY